MKVRVIKSKKRKRMASARVEDGVLLIRVPAGLAENRIKSLVEKFKKSVKTKRKFQSLQKRKWLVKRTESLNKKYFGGKLNFAIKWSKNQNKIFGSCTSKRKTIRISSRLAKIPKWVLDYILVHELAHLLEPNHSRAFWKLVNQYKKAERARGYLLGMGVKEGGED